MRNERKQSMACQFIWRVCIKATSSQLHESGQCSKREVVISRSLRVNNGIAEKGRAARALSVLRAQLITNNIKMTSAAVNYLASGFCASPLLILTCSEWWVKLSTDCPQPAERTSGKSQSKFVQICIKITNQNQINVYTPKKKTKNKF